MYIICTEAYAFRNIQNLALWLTNNWYHCLLDSVNVLSDPSINLIDSHRNRLEDDILIGEENSNVATNGMLNMQPNERYKAISLQAVDKIAER